MKTPSSLFYSKFMARTLSEECLNLLDRNIGRNNIGIITLTIRDFYPLIEKYGEEKGFCLLSLMEEKIDRVFKKNTFGYELITIEHISVNLNLICFRIQEQELTNISDHMLSFQGELNRFLNENMPELSDFYIQVNMGYSWIEREYQGGFYEVLFRAFCDSRRREDETQDAGRLDLQVEFDDILDKSLLESVYQPILNMETNSLLGWEALIRGPKESYFHQAQPLFNYAKEIGKVWVLDKKSRETAIQDMGIICIDQYLFMNVQCQSLKDPAFTPGMTRMEISKYGLKPQNIVLEFCEDPKYGDYELLLKSLEYYRAQGFKVAIDNFSQNTIRFLSQIRPDFIKLDPSLIRGISYYPLKKEMLEGILMLADKIGAKVIATGVESESELRTLNSLGVLLVQGYHIAHPNPPNPLNIRAYQVNFPRPNVIRDALKPASGP